MASLNVHRQDGRSESLQLKRGVNRIGRAPNNDLVCQCPSLSAHHCEIILEEDGVRVRDLNSTNGTFVNETRVYDFAVLRDGETLRLGDLMMTLAWNEITVSVPQIVKTAEPVCVEFEDGTWSCLNHGELKAIWHCTHCGQWFCNTCVHHLRRLGGKFLNLCPICSHACEFTGTGPKRKRKSFFKFLKKLLKAPAHKPRRRKS